MLYSELTKADSLLSEELFGTICPVLRSSTDEAIESINRLVYLQCILLRTNMSLQPVSSPRHLHFQQGPKGD